MRFFSKLTFICNLCFLAYSILSIIEISSKKAGRVEAIQLVPPVQNTLIIIGFLAVFVNLSFNLAIFIQLLRKVERVVPKWLAWSNFIFLLLQLIFYSF